MGESRVFCPPAIAQFRFNLFPPRDELTLKSCRFFLLTRAGLYAQPSSDIVYLYLYEELFSCSLLNLESYFSSEGGELPGVGEPKRPSKFGRKMAKLLKNLNMETCEPEVAVSLLRLPTMKTYTALKKKLKSSGKEWMQGFLDVGGLEVKRHYCIFLIQKQTQFLGSF